MCSMTNGNRLPPATSPAGSYQPSAQPAHLRRQRHAAGQREQGQTAARSCPRPYRQRGRPAGEQERRSRSGAGKPPPEPQQPHPATPPAASPGQQTNHATSRRPCSRSNPTQPQRPERSRERVQRRGGGEGERGAARPSVQISRPGHNMPNTPPNRPGQTVPERSSHQRHQRATGTARRAALQFCFWRECRTSDPATPEEQRETAPPGSSSPTRPGEPRHFRDTRSSTISVQYLHLHTISPKTNSTPNRHRMLYPYNSSSEPHSS